MRPRTIHRRRWWTLAVLDLSLFAVIMDNTILNVALPTLAKDLHASGSALQWIVDAYVVVLAGLLLSAGAIGDRFGRRGALSAGLVVFAAGSAFAMHVQSASMLIVARAGMGVGAALIMPATLSILTNVFADPKERATAIGLWAGVGGLGVALGPVVGGFVLEHFHWSVIFALNLPVAIVALAAGRVVVPTSRDPETPPLDVTGAVLSIAGLGSLVSAIISAGEHGWTGRTSLAGFAVAAVASGAFVAWERHTPHPMLDVRLFANPRFSAASCAVMLGYFAVFGSLFLVSQLLQLVLGFTAFDAGIRLLPFALSLAVCSAVSPKLVDRLGTKLVVVSGMSVLAAGLLWAARVGSGGTYLDYLPGLVLMGTGVALTWAPATESIMGSLPAAKAGIGSSVNDSVREVGGALGVAVAGSVLASRYTSAISSTAAVLPAGAAHGVRDSLGGAVVVAQHVGGSPGAAILHAAQAAFVDGFGPALAVAAAVAAAGAVIAAIWLPARSEPRPAGAPDPDPVTRGPARPHVDLETNQGERIMALTVDYDYSRALAGSINHSWTVDDVFEQRTFDFTKRFLPERIAGVDAIDCLDAGEKHKLNQIRGNAYCHLFAFVEEYIVPMVLANATRDVYGDETRLWSLLRFAEEEVKHQEMMRRAGAQFVEGFGVQCELVGGREAVAQAVLGTSPLSALLLTSLIEWFVQRHYVEHVRDDYDLDPLFRDLLRHHWIDESRHAKLDSLLIEEVATELSDDDRERAVDEVLELGMAVDGLLAQQMELDIDALARATSRTFTADERDEIRSAQQRAYRWTFLVSGLEHPKFLEIVDAVTRGGRAKVEAAAAMLSGTPVAAR